MAPVSFSIFARMSIAMAATFLALSFFIAESIDMQKTYGKPTKLNEDIKR